MDSTTTLTATTGGVAILRQHFAYNQWANEHILNVAAQLSQDALNATNTTTHGTALQLLLHMLDSEWGWRIICEDGVKTPYLWEVERLPDLPALREFWQAEHKRMAAYLARLYDADLLQEIDIGTIFGGESRRVKLPDLLAHILYHSDGHRRELAVYFTQQGHSPGDFDFLDFVSAPAV